MESYGSSSSGDSTSTGEIEMDNAVTSAVALAASFLQHVANPPRPVYQRTLLIVDTKYTTTPPPRLLANLFVYNDSNEA
ncbi:hypothetical protein QVD17_40543 [Tagetes erecta]|uniref:Uncharacterized protein n=1 Tax=Tagetes erecta TaxID=13708 RepID=A0AAD8NAV3_TARER|nr:hypothetical protein QVD17_40543 [Tagetes erecta]